MRGPGGLIFKQRFQHGNKNVLQPSRFQHLDCQLGPIAVERRVAHDDAHIVGVLRQYLLHDGMEGAAGLAGWVEELHDGHWRILAPEYGRIGPNKTILLFQRSGCRHRGRIGARYEPGTSHENGQYQSEYREQKCLSVHIDIRRS